jgi:hypothetical protein
VTVSAGATVAEGDADGVGDAVADGVGEAEGEGVGDADGEGDGEGDGDGEDDGDGEGDGDFDGASVGDGGANVAGSVLGDECGRGARELLAGDGGWIVVATEIRTRTLGGAAPAGCVAARVTAVAHTAATSHRMPAAPAVTVP